MNAATDLLKGNLSEREQRQLGGLLTRLDKFHTPIYRAHLTRKDSPLTERFRLAG